jgi:glyoxylase-like metal-dependent hydrolase (beta-lactamase superfamily II)/rhodanese-related sulfurtransferase
MVLIDPARDPKPYYELAEKEKATITAVIETHPHADFISSHLEIAETTGATIYCSKRTEAKYPHKTFDDGDELPVGSCILKAFNTPGHSPDGISVLQVDKTGKQKAVFTGDTLFIGDSGRPDLREKAGNIKAKRKELANQMFDSLQLFKKIDDDVKVYPAHGAGSLCGKNLSDESSSTMGAEKMTNWALKESDKQKFVDELLEGQPMIPHYFGYNVDVNQEGAPPFQKSVNEVKVSRDHPPLEKNILVIDARPEKDFKNGHLPHSFNIQGEKKFETWLGSIIKPYEPFYLTAASLQELNELIERTAKIGYEPFIKAAFIFEEGEESLARATSEFTKNNLEELVILDVRSENEFNEEKYFEKAINIPLNELREKANEIPDQGKIVVHCAGGYRSAAGASIVQHYKPNAKVYDLGDNISEFK